MAGRTVLWITHWLAAIAETDRIAVLKAGRVVESGVLAALRDNGRYLPRLLALQEGVVHL